MPPGYFALVMSTGIVSLACHLLGLAWLALILFWLNVGFYLIIWCLSLLRLGFYPRSVLKDLQSHSRAMEFFTVPIISAYSPPRYLQGLQEPGKVGRRLPSTHQP